MTNPALERGYRRLLACYPEPFRSRQQDEMLGVLMAGARPGQRWPGLPDAVNLITSALGMRLRRLGPGPAGRPWAGALAVFSVTAPLFLLVVTLLEVALPYHLSRVPLFRQFQTGGLLLLHGRGFLIAIGCQAAIAVLALLGLRWVTLAAIAASAGYWLAARYWIPDVLQLLTTGVYLLEAAALIASPGPRQGRRLLRWGHGAVLLLAAAAVQTSTLWHDAMSPFARFLPRTPSSSWAYLLASVLLAAAAVSIVLVLRLGRYFLLLLAIMLYPYALQLIPVSSSSSDLIGSPTTVHLLLLYLPPLLVACAAVIAALLPPRPVPPPEPGRPTPV